MREALQTTIRYVLEELRLHRVHANCIPNNVRSGCPLSSLGFAIEGYARDYLFINDAWRVRTSLTNQHFNAR